MIEWSGATSRRSSWTFPFLGRWSMQSWASLWVEGVGYFGMGSSLMSQYQLEDYIKVTLCHRSCLFFASSAWANGYMRWSEVASGRQLKHLEMALKTPIYSLYILLFAEAGDDQIACIREGLDLFCRASGQHVNYDKFLTFFSPNISNQEARKMSQSHGNFDHKRHGKVLGARNHTQGNMKLHDKLVSRSRCKLEGWKSKCLRRAGCLTLAHAVIKCIPTFFM